MDLLQNLLGGGQQRSEMQDFVNRYDRGAPYDGYSDDEALQRYQQVAPHLPPDVYQDAARDTFNQMSPQQRREFGQYLRQQSQQQGYNIPDFNGDGIDDRLQDPNYLAQATGRMQQQQPGLLGNLLGGSLGSGGMGGMGGGGGMLSSPLARMALGGIAAMAMKRMMSGGLGSLGGNTPSSGGIDRVPYRGGGSNEI